MTQPPSSPEATPSFPPRPRARRRWRRVVALLAALIVPPLGAVGYAGLSLRASLLRTDPAPESATGLRIVEERPAARAVVVAAHPEAARIGNEVLAAGGAAIDAAIAVQAALTLVEPQSSGIGGGAFLLYWDAKARALHAWDGRETAPAGVTPDLFLDEKKQPLSFPVAVVGGRSVGVPGVLRMLAEAHKAHGRLPWSRLFGGAVELAQRGFAVTPRLHQLLRLDPVLPSLPAPRAYLYGDDGWPHPVGARLANPALAGTLRAIADQGADAFYTGAIAADIAGAVQGAKRPTVARGALNLVAHQLGVAATGTAEVSAGGALTAADLAAYRAVERAPVCAPYRRWRVCGFPPPSSGGVTVLQALRMLERFDLARLPPGSPEAAHLLAEAERLAYADRDRWIADPGFADVPTAGLLDAEYLRARGAAIREDRTLGPAKPGQPPGARVEIVPGRSPELPSTSHFVVVDADGSIACITSSIEFGFGSHVMVRGFLLNNQLTDFSFRPERDGKPVANAVAPGKRPRSSMAPVIVFDGETGQPVLALGSPGGGRIIGYVLQALVGVLDWKLSPQAAVALPHVLNPNGKTEVEDLGWASPAARDALVEGLRARGHEVDLGQQNSGLHAVGAVKDGWIPGIDPRREGAAAGQ